MVSKKTRIFEGALVLIVLGLVAAILYPVQAGGGHWQYAPGDLSNLRQIAVGFEIYETDYDDRLAPEKGWLDTLYPYTKNTQIAVCNGLAVPSEGTLFGHAMSHGMGGILTTKVPHPELTLLAFDSVDLSKSAVSDPWEMPVPGRLKGMNCVVFLDTHAKMVKPGSLTP